MWSIKVNGQNGRQKSLSGLECMKDVTLNDQWFDFFSWGLIQSLDLESLSLRRCSEDREGITLLWTFRWRGMKSLVLFRWHGKNLAKLPQMNLIRTRDICSLAVSGPCWNWLHLLITPSLLHSVVVWGPPTWDWCVIGTVCQLGRAAPLLPTMWASPALLRDGNSHFTEPPFSTLQNLSSWLAYVRLYSAHAPGFEIYGGREGGRAGLGAKSEIFENAKAI